MLTGRHGFDVIDVRRAMDAVATFRRVPLTRLDEALAGYEAHAQARWLAWRNRQGLQAMLPLEFKDVLDALKAFANPVLTGTLTVNAVWDPALRSW